MDPSAAMQEEAKKKEVFSVQKSADEFLDECVVIDQCFDRAMCVATPHHFVDAVM